MRPAPRWLWLVAMAVAGLAGCRSAHVQQTRNGGLDYQQAHLVYEVNGRFRDLPLGGDAVVHADHATDETAPHHWQSVRLQVDYPHPEGIPDLARATLRLSTQPESVYTPVGSEAFHEPSDFPRDLAAPIVRTCDDEIWVLDIPRGTLDSLLVELNGSGFFQPQQRNEIGTRVDVRINDGRTAKAWTPEPRLDEFVERVHTDGRLSGFVACGCQLPPSGPSLVARSAED